MRTTIKRMSAYKSMSLLGDLAFGPRCGTCGGFRVEQMYEPHRQAFEHMLGKPVRQWERACHCVDRTTGR